MSGSHQLAANLTSRRKRKPGSMAVEVSGGDKWVPACAGMTRKLRVALPLGERRQ
jgi:hypothetical protein